MSAFTIDASGVHETEAPADLVQKVEAKEGAERTARERREALKSQSGPRIETVQLGGESWYIKRLDWPSYMLAAVLLGRDANSRIRSGEIDVLRALTVVALHCGVATGPDDPTPYFSQAEAHAWASEPEGLLLVGQIYNEVVRRNPELLPVDSSGASGNGAGATRKAGSSSSPARKRRASRKSSGS